MKHKELVDVAIDITNDFDTNGEWTIDCRSGIIFGKKATTGTSDTAAYKVMTKTT